MKKKQLIIVASLLTLIAVVALGVVLLVNREKPKKTLTLETSTSIASSKAKDSSSSTRKQYTIRLVEMFIKLCLSYPKGSKRLPIPQII